MRKEAIIQITDEGRDQGKVFAIREMSALQAEKWARRALIALARSGADIPDDFDKAGMAGLAVAGFRVIAGINDAEIEPLLDEMLQCISVRPNPNDRSVSRPLYNDGVSDDIEEVATLFKLRQEVFNLHINFSKFAARLKQASAAASITAKT
jgi:hypothetical protein